MKDLTKAIVYGTAVGDALGVPVEFVKREILKMVPVTGMREFGSHNQPAGTWSDDTSLLLAIVDGMSKGCDIDKIADNFILWFYHGGFTAHNEVFDCGGTTYDSLKRLMTGHKPVTDCGCKSVDCQGNGSLMRTLGLVPFVKDLPIEERFRIVSDVSSLTHATFNCSFACFFLVEYALTILELKGKINYGMTQLTALILTQDKIKDFIKANNISQEELGSFARVLGPLEKLTEDDIVSSGYVIATLEASIWSLITTTSYREAVLKAVNLGKDTDTTGAVTGGLAGILYGIESIPAEWIEAIANKSLLDSISDAI